MSDLSTPLALRRDRSILSLLGLPPLSPIELGGWLIAGGTWLMVVSLAVPLGRQLKTGQEAFCYWVASIHAPYTLSDWTQPIAYVYSPAFRQAIAPLTELPWLGFFSAWTALLLLAVRFLTGPRLFAVGVLSHRGIDRRQHLAVPGGRDGRRVPLARGVGTRVADQGDSRDRAALVRRPTRVAIARHRARGHGPGDRGFGRDPARRVAAVAGTAGGAGGP
jgi:hypothetical protein